LCVGSIWTIPSQALPQKPWYLTAADRFLRIVHNENPAVQAPAGDKQLDQSYSSRITKEENTITLKGDVPSDGDLKILQGVVAANSPGATLADKSRLNANVPDRDVWLAAMTFALRQLGKLEHGSAQLRNNFIVIDGVTKAGDDFAAVQKKLRDEAPKVLSL